MSHQKHCKRGSLYSFEYRLLLFCIVLFDRLSYICYNPNVRADRYPDYFMRTKKTKKLRPKSKKELENQTVRATRSDIRKDVHLSFHVSFDCMQLFFKQTKTKPGVFSMLCRLVLLLNSDAEAGRSRLNDWHVWRKYWSECCCCCCCCCVE